MKHSLGAIDIKKKARKLLFDCENIIDDTTNFSEAIINHGLVIIFSEDRQAYRVGSG